jgi:hypothetical protein
VWVGGGRFGPGFPSAARPAGALSKSAAPAPRRSARCRPPAGLPPRRPALGPLQLIAGPAVLGPLQAARRPAAPPPGARPVAADRRACRPRPVAGRPALPRPPPRTASPLPGRPEMSTLRDRTSSPRKVWHRDGRFWDAFRPRFAVWRDWVAKRGRFRPAPPDGVVPRPPTVSSLVPRRCRPSSADASVPHPPTPPSRARRRFRPAPAAASVPPPPTLRSATRRNPTLECTTPVISASHIHRPGRRRSRCCQHVRCQCRR